jgi:hypothetical protein
VKVDILRERCYSVNSGLTPEEQGAVELLKKTAKTCCCGKRKTPSAHLCRSCSSRRTYDTRYLAWREAVLAGDDWTCQVCGHRDPTGRTLQAHHLSNWKRHVHLRYVVSNGATLCTKDASGCHDGFHARFGAWGNNAHQLDEYIRDESWRREVTP